MFPFFRSVFLLSLTLLMGGCSLLSPKTQVGPPPEEVRGVWITNVNDALASREKIAETMKDLADAHFNVVFPVVWNNATTLYPSAVMKESFGVEINPAYAGRDPLAEVIEEAHRNGLEVIPWFEYGFSCSYKQNGGPILEQKPEWAALDQDGHLVAKNGFEWMNGFDPEVQQFITSLVMEVVKNYDVDGIQGDDRLPAMPSSAGYDAKTVARWKKEFGTEPPRDIKDPKWVQWRANILNDFLADLYKKVKAEKPNAIVAMSPNIHDWCLYEYLQDPKSWVERGIVDALQTQLYRRTLEDYQKIADAVAKEDPYAKGTAAITSPGILIKLGDYRIARGLLLDMVKYNRELGLKGETYFYNPGLWENEKELGNALKDGPYREAATLPWRHGNVWRPKGIIVPAATAKLDGSWVTEDGEDFTLAASADGSAVYSLSVPIAGYYDVHTDTTSAGTSYSVVTQGRGADAAISSEKASGDDEWTKVCTAYVGKESRCIIRPTMQDGEWAAHAGSLLLVLNREKSPEVFCPAAAPQTKRK